MKWKYFNYRNRLHLIIVYWHTAIGLHIGNNTNNQSSERNMNLQCRCIHIVTFTTINGVLFVIVD